MRLTRWLLIILVLSGVALALIWGYRPRPALVDTARVTSAPLSVTIEEEGKTRVGDRFLISSPLAGYLRRITLKEGDSILQDGVVATLEPLRASALDARARAQAEAQASGAESTVAAARQRVRAAQSDASYWEGELARVQEMVKTGDMARERLDRTMAENRRAAATLEEVEKRVQVAEAELRASRAALQVSAFTPGEEIVPVRAPVGGRVLKVVRESEGPVSAGEALLELGSVRSLEVVIELLSADAVKVKPGMKVLFTRWGGDQPLEGRVRIVEPLAFTKVSALGVAEQRVNVIADIVTPREIWQRLGAGYRLEASFVLWEDPKVLQAPSSALFRADNAWNVFLVENETVIKRKVEIGQRTGTMSQILSGLKPGDAVIAHPDTTITAGKKVTARG